MLTFQMATALEGAMSDIFQPRNFAYMFKDTKFVMT